MINDRAEQIQRHVQAATKRVDGLRALGNRITRGYLDYLMRAIQAFSSKGINEAAVFAYWALFSLFPLVVLTIIIATTVFDIRNIRPQIASVLTEFSPGSVDTFLRDNINQLIVNRRSISLISSISLLLGATRLFTALQRSMSRIFDDPRPRRWHRQMILGVIMIAVFALLLIASQELTTLLKTLNLQLVGRRSPLLGVGTSLASIITNATLFVLLYRYIPQRRVAWAPLLLFAISGAVVFELSHSLFDWYVQHISNFGVVYGSLSAVIGLLTWMFVYGCIILMCGELARATDDWRIARLLAREPQDFREETAATPPVPFSTE